MRIIAHIFEKEKNFFSKYEIDITHQQDELEFS